MNKSHKLLTAFFTLCTFVAAYAAGTLSPVNSGLKPAEILSHDVKVVINNGFAQTEVTQQFQNINDSIMEAIYSFPVPQSASMSECHVQIGETMMDGEVIVKEQAQQIYEQEKNSGGNAAIADKDGYQDFTFRIANVHPQETATISFVYYQPLPIDTGVCRYAYPLEEGNTKDDAAASFWTRNSKPIGKTNVRVILRSAWPVAAIRAPYGTPIPQQENLSEGLADITYELTDGLTKDFVFYYNLADNLPGRLEVVPFKKQGQEGTFMMVLTPGVDLQPITQGSDYVFVLDNSGSMSGEKIRTLAKGVTQTIQQMNSNDRFRVIFFSDYAVDLTKGYLTATPENIQATVEKLAKVQPESSTNIYAGLKKALDNLDDDRVSSLILVTDGVANTGEVNPAAFAKLMQNADIRVFGFLMGNNSNWPLMRAICNASGGFYDGVSNSDDIIGKILLAKSKIVNEAMHDVKVSIKGVDTYDITNQCVKKLYRGQQLVMFGKYKNGGQATVTMKTKISGQEQEYSCKMMFPDEDLDNPELERLWALAQIEMHEDMVNSGMTQAEEFKDFVKNIGVEYQLVTDETSMIVLDAETHKKHQIERKNKVRSDAERLAQSQRYAGPVMNYRADVEPATSTAPATSYKRPAQTYAKPASLTRTLFDLPAAVLGGGGGGAIDPVALMMIGCVAAVAYILPKRKRNK